MKYLILFLFAMSPIIAFASSGEELFLNLWDKFDIHYSSWTYNLSYKSNTFYTWAINDSEVFTDITKEFISKYFFISKVNNTSLYIIHWYWWEWWVFDTRINKFYHFPTYWGIEKVKAWKKWIYILASMNNGACYNELYMIPYTNTSTHKLLFASSCWELTDNYFTRIEDFYLGFGKVNVKYFDSRNNGKTLYKIIRI